MSLPIMGVPDKKQKKLTVYTIEECINCKKPTKREFKDGDLVHKILDKCKDCDNNIMISLIYGEEIKKKKN